MARRRDRRIWFVALGVFVAVFLFSFLAAKFKRLEEAVDAASLANFDPGYIISDWQMGNYNSMSEAEIQAFLTKKNPCSNRDYGYFQRLSASNPNIKWHFDNGHFICLSEEKFGDGEVIGSGETAAHIIWQAAQDYKINPQVLIVLIQKESSLITDPIPNDRDYRSATGYGCPDTAPCSSEYYGFKNQVRKAASLFSTVLNGGWTNYPLGNNYIQYNPSASCGGSVVNIRSLATSALYRYTPYQPNAGAIAAGYGTAHCGAYGNRNFYLYFEDWFGGVKDEVEVAIEAKTEFKNSVLDGEYMIISKQTGKTIDVRGGVYKGLSSAETIMFNKKENLVDADNQIFYISYNKNTGYYNIKNLVSNLYFDVKGGSITNSTPVIMWKETGGCNQDWLLESDDSGFFTIVSRCSSKALDATVSDKLILFKKHNEDNQKWLLKPVQSTSDKILNGDYQIQFSNSQEALDISGGINSEMTSGNVVKFAKKNLDSDSIDNQIFRLIYNDNERIYKIINPKSNLILKSGDVVTVSSPSGDCSEKWLIRKNDDTYKIVSSCDNSQLEVSNTQIGSAMAMTTKNNNKTFSNNFVFNLANQNTDNNALKEDVDYQIITNNGNMAIDVSGGIFEGMSRGELVVFRKKDEDVSNQTYRLKYNNEKDAYLIYNPKSNLYLDVAGAKELNNTEIILFKHNDGCNQYWKIDDNNNISSLCSGKYLVESEIFYGSAKRIVISSDKKQKWVFNEVY